MKLLSKYLVQRRHTAPNLFVAACMTCRKRSGSGECRWHTWGDPGDYQLRRTSRLTNDFPNSLFVSRIRIMVVIASTHQGCADTSGLPYLRRVHVRVREKRLACERNRESARASRFAGRARGTRREIYSPVAYIRIRCRRETPE